MLKEYLKTSPIAESIQLEGSVVLNRLKLSREDLVQMQQTGEFESQFNKKNFYELEVNGLTIALGKIVKKRGEYYFKITELNKE